MQGEHLFDTMDDGTEIAAPIYREDSSNTVTDERSHDTVEDSELEHTHSRWEHFAMHWKGGRSSVSPNYLLLTKHNAIEQTIASSSRAV